MNTKAAIGVLDDTGKVLGIICHYDGYLQGVGKTLFEHYNTMSSVIKLLDLGTLVKLGSTIDTTTVASRNTSCRWIEPREFETIGDFERYFQVADYCYLYQNHNWTYKQNLKENIPYALLEFAFI